jgi:hypothetical protein
MVAEQLAEALAAGTRLSRMGVADMPVADMVAAGVAERC